MILSVPFFYSEELAQAGGLLALDESTSRHIGQVLRMKKGDPLILTDGKGRKCRAVLTELAKKVSTVCMEEDPVYLPPLLPDITIAISLLKNTVRFEWFLEKATETGIHTIVPLICERTERTHLRLERMKNILISAMLQSQQSWLPRISVPVSFNEWVAQSQGDNKYIAHCLATQKMDLSSAAARPGEKVICIGPEGDFTEAEIAMALQYHFVPVTLGNTRLRTETAGLAAAVLLRLSSRMVAS